MLMPQMTIYRKSIHLKIMLRNVQNGRNWVRKPERGYVAPLYINKLTSYSFSRAEKYPDSCTDERHSAFLFMSLACMKSCNIRKVRINAQSEAVLCFHTSISATM